MPRERGLYGFVQEKAGHKGALPFLAGAVPRITGCRVDRLCFRAWQAWDLSAEATETGRPDMIHATR
jgi:hypothetical protein